MEQTTYLGTVRITAEPNGYFVWKGLGGLEYDSKHETQREATTRAHALCREYKPDFRTM